MLVFYLIALFISFILLARIVDLFFISSLDKISGDLKLSNDAAGATLMAAGSSAPELFVALFAVLKPGEHEAIGIGSIVGSAIFNILVIVGVAAIIRKSKLTWQPVVRDLAFYFIAVSLLLLGIMDGKFTLIEALSFLMVYVIYIIAVVYWKKLLPYEDEKGTGEVQVECNKSEIGTIRLFDHFLCFIFPSRNRYYLVFFTSILIIAALSWVLVELAVKISVVLNIPEAIIALTVIAIGTSVPDLFSSIIVARQGRSDMAVSNAVGSNIFDILVGLGLPFIISVLIFGVSIDVTADNLLTSSIILFSSVVLLILMLLISKWKIGKISGFILLACYLFYLLREIYFVM